MIIGIDEAGRGPWAGPLVVVAAILERPIDGLADSKDLTPKRREALTERLQNSIAWGAGWVPPAQIDELGLTNATIQAVHDALAALGDIAEHDIVVDGSINYASFWPNSTAIIKADSTIPSVMAASILAKVIRDAYMVELDATYPGYGFAQHKGYGTKAHREALNKLGVCPEHRLSFKPVRLVESRK
jgi:ribonuclease HII